MRGRGGGPGVSFFAFQDIITAVVGIFILITVILVLELAQRIETAAAEQSVNDTSAIEETIAALKARVDAKEAELRARRGDADRSAVLNRFNREDRIRSAEAGLAAKRAELKAQRAKRDELRKKVTAADARAVTLARAAKDLDDERARIRQLAETMKEIERESDKLVGDEASVYRDQTQSGRSLVLIKLNGRRIEIRDGKTRRVDALDGASRLDRTRSFLNGVDPSTRQLFVMIAPGGAADFQTLTPAIEASKIPYGFTVVTAEDSTRLKFEVAGQAGATTNTTGEASPAAENTP